MAYQPAFSRVQASQSHSASACFETEALTHTLISARKIKQHQPLVGQVLRSAQLAGPLMIGAAPVLWYLNHYYFSQVVNDVASIALREAIRQSLKRVDPQLDAPLSMLIMASRPLVEFVAAGLSMKLAWKYRNTFTGQVGLGIASMTLAYFLFRPFHDLYFTYIYKSAKHEIGLAAFQMTEAVMFSTAIKGMYFYMFFHTLFITLYLAASYRLTRALARLRPREIGHRLRNHIQAFQIELTTAFSHPVWLLGVLVGSAFFAALLPYNFHLEGNLLIGNALARLQVLLLPTKAAKVALILFLLTPLLEIIPATIARAYRRKSLGFGSGVYFGLTSAFFGYSIGRFLIDIIWVSLGYSPLYVASLGYGYLHAMLPFFDPITPGGQFLGATLFTYLYWKTTRFLMNHYHAPAFVPSLKEQHQTELEIVRDHERARIQQDIENHLANAKATIDQVRTRLGSQADVLPKEIHQMFHTAENAIEKAQTLIKAIRKQGGRELAHALSEQCEHLLQETNALKTIIKTKKREFLQGVHSGRESSASTPEQVEQAPWTQILIRLETIRQDLEEKTSHPPDELSEVTKWLAQCDLIDAAAASIPEPLIQNRWRVESYMYRARAAVNHTRLKAQGPQEIIQYYQEARAWLRQASELAKTTPIPISSRLLIGMQQVYVFTHLSAYPEASQTFKDTNSLAQRIVSALSKTEGSASSSLPSEIFEMLLPEEQLIVTDRSHHAHEQLREEVIALHEGLDSLRVLFPTQFPPIRQPPTQPRMDISKLQPPELLAKVRQLSAKESPSKDDLEEGLRLAQAAVARAGENPKQKDGTIAEASYHAGTILLRLDRNSEAFQPFLDAERAGQRISVNLRQRLDVWEALARSYIERAEPAEAQRMYETMHEVCRDLLQGIRPTGAGRMMSDPQWRVIRSGEMKDEIQQYFKRARTELKAFRRPAVQAAWNERNEKRKAAEETRIERAREDFRIQVTQAEEASRRQRKAAQLAATKRVNALRALLGILYPYSRLLAEQEAAEEARIAQARIDFRKQVSQAEVGTRKRREAEREATELSTAHRTLLAVLSGHHAQLAEEETEKARQRAALIEQLGQALTRAFPMIPTQHHQEMVEALVDSGRTSDTLASIEARLQEESARLLTDPSWQLTEETCIRFADIFRDVNIDNTTLAEAAILILRDDAIHQRLPQVRWPESELTRTLKDWLYEAGLTEQTIEEALSNYHATSVADLVRELALPNIFENMHPQDREKITTLLLPETRPFLLLVELQKHLLARATPLSAEQSKKVASLFTSATPNEKFIPQALKIISRDDALIKGWEHAAQEQWPDAAEQAKHLEGARARALRDYVEIRAQSARRQPVENVRPTLEAFANWLTSVAPSPEIAMAHHNRPQKWLENMASHATLTRERLISFALEGFIQASESLHWLRHMGHLADDAGKPEGAAQFHALVEAIDEALQTPEPSSTADPTHRPGQTVPTKWLWNKLTGGQYKNPSLEAAFTAIVEWMPRLLFALGLFGITVFRNGGQAPGLLSMTFMTLGGAGALYSFHEDFSLRTKEGRRLLGLWMLLWMADLASIYVTIHVGWVAALSPVAFGLSVHYFFDKIQFIKRDNAIARARAKPVSPPITPRAPTPMRANPNAGVFVVKGSPPQANTSAQGPRRIEPQAPPPPIVTPPHIDRALARDFRRAQQAQKALHEQFNKAFSAAVKALTAKQILTYKKDDRSLRAKRLKPEIDRVFFMFDTNTRLLVLDVFADELRPQQVLNAIDGALEGYPKDLSPLGAGTAAQALDILLSKGPDEEIPNQLKSLLARARLAEALPTLETADLDKMAQAFALSSRPFPWLATTLSHIAPFLDFGLTRDDFAQMVSAFEQDASQETEVPIETRESLLESATRLVLPMIQTRDIPTIALHLSEEANPLAILTTLQSELQHYPDIVMEDEPSAAVASAFEKGEDLEELSQRVTGRLIASATTLLLPELSTTDRDLVINLFADKKRPLNLLEGIHVARQRSSKSQPLSKYRAKLMAERFASSELSDAQLPIEAGQLLGRTYDERELNNDLLAICDRFERTSLPLYEAIELALDTLRLAPQDYRIRQSERVIRLLKAFPYPGLEKIWTRIATAQVRVRRGKQIWVRDISELVASLPPNAPKSLVLVHYKNLKAAEARLRARIQAFEQQIFGVKDLRTLEVIRQRIFVFDNHLSEIRAQTRSTVQVLSSLGLAAADLPHEPTVSRSVYEEGTTPLFEAKTLIGRPDAPTSLPTLEKRADVKPLTEEEIRLQEMISTLNSGGRLIYDNPTKGKGLITSQTNGTSTVTLSDGSTIPIKLRYALPWLSTDQKKPGRKTVATAAHAGTSTFKEQAEWMESLSLVLETLEQHIAAVELAEDLEDPAEQRDTTDTELDGLLDQSNNLRAVYDSKPFFPEEQNKRLAPLTARLIELLNEARNARGIPYADLVKRLKAVQNRVHALKFQIRTMPSPKSGGGAGVQTGPKKAPDERRRSILPAIERSLRRLQDPFGLGHDPGGEVLRGAMLSSSPGAVRHHSGRPATHQNQKPVSGQALRQARERYLASQGILTISLERLLKLKSREALIWASQHAGMYICASIGALARRFGLEHKHMRIILQRFNIRTMWTPDRTRRELTTAA